MIALLATALAGPLDAGAYQLEVTIATRAKVPFAGEATVFTRSTALAVLDPDGDGYRVHQTLCAVAVDDDLKMSTTLVPEAFVAAHPVQTYPSAVRLHDGVWTWSADPGPTDVGWDRTLTDTLPEKRSEDGVIDFEGDGEPGATLVLDVPVFGRVSVYVAQHGHSRYQGTIAQGGVSGLVEVVAMEQRTLGASNPFFKADPKVTLDPANSVFRLTPAPGATTCGDLVR